MLTRTAFSGLAAVAAVALLVSPAAADTFGSDGNQFTLDFVPISGATNPTEAQANDTDRDLDGFGIVDYDYRMGVHEVTNDQWNKFKAGLGVGVTGTPSYAYRKDPYWTGLSMPTNCASWYEAAQFVNWLNTSTGHQAAYKFTDTQGTGTYTFETWDSADAWGGTNLYRHKNAFYFLPDEHEWVKVAYWNGTELQTYATKNGAMPVAGTHSNYGQSLPYDGPWDVGSGSEELNGTYDMMGNMQEWMESPWTSGNYSTGGDRAARGGRYLGNQLKLPASWRNGYYSGDEAESRGFRVASIPEPGCITLLLCGLVAGLMCRRRSR